MNSVIHPSFWDISLTVAVLIQVTKLSDWILRPKQQDWVSKAFDSIALRLDEIKPLSWFHFIQAGGTQRILLGIGIVIYLIINAGLFASATEYGYQALITFLVVLATDIFVFYHWSIPALDEMFSSSSGTGPKVGVKTSDPGEATGCVTTVDRPFNWKDLKKEVAPGAANPDDSPLASRFGLFLWRYVMFIVRTALIMLPLALLLLGLRYLFGRMALYEDTEILYFVIMLVFSLPVVALQGLLWIVGLAGLFVILAQVLLLCSSLILAILRGIVWRIVEYNKGVWAAVTLLLTVSLAVIDIYIRATHGA